MGGKGDLDAQFVGNFVAKFGADFSATLTPKQMVDLSLAWASFWIRVRTRSVITTARDDYVNLAWFNGDYKNKGYIGLVQANNDLVHEPNMGEDLMLAPVAALMDSDGIPALQTVFPMVYRLSKEDALDLLRYAQEKTDRKRPTDAARLFSYMANWLENFSSWRNSVCSTIRARGSAVRPLRTDMTTLDPLVDTAIRLMCHFINEWRTTGADAAQVARNWTTLDRTLLPINQAVTTLTNQHALHTDARWRTDTVRRAAMGFPTKTRAEMQDPPWLPSMLHLQPQADTEMFEQSASSTKTQSTAKQAPQQPPSTAVPPPQGKNGSNGNNNPFAPNPYQQPGNNQYPNSGNQGFNTNRLSYASAAMKRTRTRAADEGQVKRARWSDELEL
ncbi:uncharacterized protein PG986_004400 [Apiospora aurea]|uniref:Uncharacterized protein n=1 Tax=Apiospora aurea TaxID=335848 RepID=A0ABR1QMU5_9PEZI